MEIPISPEQELLLQAQQFKSQALGEIYDTCSPGLYRYAVRLLGDACLAEDCVAETFSRFLKSLQVRQGPRNHLQAYLYRIAHNWIVDYYRRQPVTDELSESLASETAKPEESAALHMRQLQLRSAIRKLTPDQQQVITLKFLENFDNEEIARILRKPISAIKSIQHRALDSLRKLLSEKDEL